MTDESRDEGVPIDAVLLDAVRARTDGILEALRGSPFTEDQRLHIAAAIAAAVERLRRELIDAYAPPKTFDGRRFGDRKPEPGDPY